MDNEYHLRDLFFLQMYALVTLASILRHHVWGEGPFAKI